MHVLNITRKKKFAWNFSNSMSIAYNSESLYILIKF